MKRMIAVILLAVFVLAGCGAKAEQPKKAAATIRPAEETTLPETEPTEEIQPSEEPEIVPTEPETVPEEPAEEPPVATEEPSEEPQEPQNTLPPAETPTPQPEPETPATPQQTTQQTKPQQTTNSRPTSSSTSKDTGSNRRWDHPTVHSWEETDPQRTSYINSNTNSTYSTMLAGNDGMAMFVGHTYGMKFLHNGDASDLRWFSSNTTVATVNEVGFVTPLQQGVTEIGFYCGGQRYSHEVCVFWEPDYTEAQLEQMAKEEAKRIAEYVMGLSVSTDLERIGAAALIINKFIAIDHTIPSYTINDDGSISCNVVGYNRPFGTFITGYSTCAGNVRALGMILEYMGFEWYHVNANQWDHQWCVVYDVDGQTAFADGAYMGVVGYGERQEDGSNWQQYNREIDYNIQLAIESGNDIKIPLV